MPRYYCDYCDTYLTHDSPSVRKQHNAGYKHKANVRTYYQQFEEQQTQSLIDQKIKEHLGQAAAFQVGAPFNQHLMSFQSNPQGARMPLIPPPILPIPQASFRPPIMPGIRPPILPPPIAGALGYMAGVVPAMPPGMPTLVPPGSISTSMQMDGLPTGDLSVSMNSTASGSNGGLPAINPSAYQAGQSQGNN